MPLTATISIHCHLTQFIQHLTREKMNHKPATDLTQRHTHLCLKKLKESEFVNFSYLLMRLFLDRPCPYVSSLLCCVSPGAVMAAARVTANSPHWLKQLQRGLSLVGGRISRPIRARESTWFGKQQQVEELSRRTKSRVEII